MTERPDFDALLDAAELSADERARLERVHELLVEAGPPPELPPELGQPPEIPQPGWLPRRRRLTLALVAAAIALATFGAGFLVGDRQDDLGVFAVLPMEGEEARASLTLFDVDDAGNWPMELVVRGLPELPKGELYELWLTKAGEPKASCGTFAVSGAKTEVLLNAPFRLREFDGWIVTRAGSDEPLLTTT